MLRSLFVLGTGVFILVMASIAELPVQAAEKRAPGHQASSEQAVILGTVWGHTLAQDGSGFYNDLMADMLAAQGDGEAAYKLLPYRRATAAFKANRSACLYPSAKSVLSATGLKGAAYVETDPLFAAQEYLFARAGQTPPSAMADLKGKTIAVPNGSIMLKMLKGTGARLITVHNETDKAQMLMTGRVDMMSGMLPNEHIIAQDLGTSMPSYDRNFPLVDAGVAVVCHDTTEGRQMVNMLNRKIRALQAEPGFRQKLAAAGVFETRGVSAADLNAMTPASGHKLRFVHPGRRLPFSNIR